MCLALQQVFPFTAISITVLPRLPFSYPVTQNPRLTLIFEHFDAPMLVNTSHFLLELAILQARMRALNQDPIRETVRYKKVYDMNSRCNMALTFQPRAAPTWKKWLEAANGLLSFLERYEYVEFTFWLLNDRGAVLAVGDLADLRRSAMDGDG